MRTLLFVVLLGCCLATEARAEPPAPLEDRVTILTVEMNRGPAEALAPFLEPDAHPLSRWYAVRALGRIGDRGKAPEMLAAFLDAGRQPLEGALWAAGIAQTEKLYDAIARHLDDEDPRIVAAAAEALGWTGRPGAAEAISPFLTTHDPRVLAGALMGLARCRKEGYLERVAPRVHHGDARVRRAADFCCWMLAGARKRAAKEGWDGEEGLAPTFLRELGEDDPVRRLAALRALGNLLSTTLRRGEDLEPVFATLDDPDPRVTQEAISRVLRSRKGPAVDRYLREALDHADPKVRSMAAEALAEREDDASKQALKARIEKETDLRVRDDLAVAVAKRGDPEAFATIASDPARLAKVEAAYRQMTRAQVLLAREDALAELLTWVTVPAVRKGDVHSVVAMTVIDALSTNDDASIGPWLETWVAGTRPIDFDDPYLAASAITALARRGDLQRIGALCEEPPSAETHGEVRLALTKAFGDVAARDDTPGELKARLTAWLRRALTGDPSAWVQDAARSALEALGADVPPVETLEATEWVGIPAPSRALQAQLGLASLDMSDSHVVVAGDPWMGERGILQLADALFELRPRVVFETTQGTFAVELDPDAAPVHCASLVVSVDGGTYTNTRWHRVVPSFVIQGGDPLGHGAGNSGYFIPDEITRTSYARGVLGMPKSRKDDGGCQLFFMHSPYIPLDGRYTAYGRIVDGLEVVDRIRVGDRILEARIQLPK